jgi:hypothetical protein
MRPSYPLLSGLAAVGALVAGCTAPPTPAQATGAASAPPVTDARLQVAALAAAAEDRAFSAFYTLTASDRDPRTVVVTRAGDGSWRVDVPGGALGGTADISVAQLGPGIFTCNLPSAVLPTASTCVQVAKADSRVPQRYDPQVQHPFSDWIEVLIDRQSAIAVSPSAPLPDAQGTCYAIESISAALAAPMDVGIYCFAADGLLTAARTSFGTLMLQGAPAVAPPSVSLPGPVVTGEPLGMVAPPPPPVPSYDSSAQPLYPTPIGATG